MITGLNHLFYKDRLRELGPVSLETRRLTGGRINVYKYLNRRCQEDGARSRWCRAIGREATSRNEKFHVNTRKYCKDDRALVQAAQRVWGVSISGDIQEPSGRSPVPCALVGPDVPLRSLPTAVLWLCAPAAAPARGAHLSTSTSARAPARSAGGCGARRRAPGARRG